LAVAVATVDIASVVLRLAIGGTLFAHGYHHAFGGGKLEGTGRWFESLGLRPGIVHAAVATLTEAGAGLALIFGFLTPLAAGAITGTMLVALITNHLKNGFFIFRPGEGYEYVLMIILVSLALASLGGGRFSLDKAIGFSFVGWGALGCAAAIGVGGSAMLLVSCWRPNAIARD
jgi:putative oxidoreductase